MMHNTSSLLTCGIYSVPEASRLTGVSTGRIRRWATAAGQPLWTPALPDQDGKSAITFHEMLEAAAVALLLDGAGHTLAGFRDLHAAVPSAHRFPLLNSNVVLSDSLGSPLRPLLDQLDYRPGAALPHRWWPTGRDAFIVLDPARSFGEPVLDRTGTPTRAIAAPILAGNETAKSSASCWEASIQEVEAAVYFERRLGCGVGFFSLQRGSP
ncbi:hypothetical protein [Azospirillum argentinense]|uniref:DUF433 domain-containing protein n=1 Tax=Azospirillum brasilense TaxID=192 RepID=A0A4D8QEJ9_AZOBR|nr:hypothetical protein [Azospirillum argentinense]QCO07293.1 hypothetical protein D3867_36035 [Azospirillum argentinense]